MLKLAVLVSEQGIKNVDSLHVACAIKAKGMHILAQFLGEVEAERFIALIQRAPFDYTKWRQHQDIEQKSSVEEISRRATDLRRKDTEKDT